MLKVGDRAPDFTAQSTSGGAVSLAALRGKTVVLYFFRRAFTPNCTVQTLGFRDNYPELAALGCEVVGVSSDSHATQCRFVAEHLVTFPRVADADRSISRAYDALFWITPVSHRVTYVIDEGGTIIGVFNHEFQVLKHLDEVLRFVRSARTTWPPDPPAP